MSPGGCLRSGCPPRGTEGRLKGQEALPSKCSSFLGACRTSDPLVWGSPGGPVPPRSCPRPLPASAHPSFNAALVAAAATLEALARSLSLALPSRRPLGDAGPREWRAGQLPPGICSPRPDGGVSGLSSPFWAGGFLQPLPSPAFLEWMLGVRQENSARWWTCKASRIHFLPSTEASCLYRSFSQGPHWREDDSSRRGVLCFRLQRESERKNF